MKQLDSLEQATNVSAANLVGGVKTPGSLYVNKQGNRVNFNEDQNKRIQQLLSDIQRLRTEQDAIAKIVDEISDGSTRDYEFVKAYSEAIQKDQIVNKGVILPQLGEILRNHPAAQTAQETQLAGGQEMLNKAKAAEGYSTGK